MPRRYLKAETAVLALPKKIVFVDKKNKKHLLPALTKSHHLATHYGHSAIDLITGKQKFAKLTNKGSLTTAKRIRKVATKKIAEAEKATKEVKKAVVKANTAVATAQKAKRKYTKKKTEAIKAATAVAATAPVVVAAPVAAAKKRGRKPLTAEQKAANKLFRDQKKKSLTMEFLSDFIGPMRRGQTEDQPGFIGPLNRQYGPQPRPLMAVQEGFMGY